MTSLFLIVLGAVAAFSAALTIRLVNSRVRGLDHPKEHSIHTVPTPRLGGVAVIISTFIGVIVSGWIVAGDFDKSVLVTLGCALGLFASFVVEDLIGVSWQKRLAVQFLFAALFLSTSGVWLPIEQLVPPALGGWPLILIVPIGVVWAMNLYNFMDGMDVLAGGMSVSGFIALGLLAFLTGHEWIGVTACAAVAGALGFLAFNLPPARIFLGDAGSVPLGFLGAALGLMLVARGAIAPIVPLLVFAPFVIEATATLMTRAMRGIAFWQPHRQHWYQRMVLAGWSHRRALTIYYPLMLLSAVSAFAYHYDWPPGRLAIVGALLAVHGFLPVLASSLEARRRHLAQNARKESTTEPRRVRTANT